MQGKDEIIQQNMHIVDEVINSTKFPRFLTDDERDELKSIGYLAIVEAVKSFSNKLNVPLNYWIKKNIQWSIFNFFRDEKKEYFPYIQEEQTEIECILDLKNAYNALFASEKELLNDILFFGFTQEEIARKLNISQQSVSKRYKKIISKLRKYYGSK